MKRGVLFAVFVLLLVPLACAFDVEVTPKSIYAEVQAGGYVSELVEISADAPIEVFASASPALIPLVRITRHDATSVVVHVLPPIDSPETTVVGTLQLDVQGKSPLLSAGVQQASIPLNVTISVKGRAPAPAIIDLGSEKEIEMVPLSSDSATLVVGIIIGLIVLNIVLRMRVRGRNKR